MEDAKFLCGFIEPDEPFESDSGSFGDAFMDSDALPESYDLRLVGFSIHR